MQVLPHWLDDSEAFWYRNDLSQGGREFVFVDSLTGARTPAFDHEQVAAKISPDTRATHLPIERLEYSTDRSVITMIGASASYRWDVAKGELHPISASERASAIPREVDDWGKRGRSTGAETSVLFENISEEIVEIFWLSGDGSKQSYGKIAPGASRDQHTFGGHRWLVANGKGEPLGELSAWDAPRHIVIDGKPRYSAPTPRNRPFSGNRSRDGMRSPDGKWTAHIIDSNVVAQGIETGERIVLSSDGTEDDFFRELVWSPDSETLIAFREKKVEKKPVHIIRSSPPNGGRAELESHPYALPGDPFPTYEVNLLKVPTSEQLKPEVERFEREWGSPRVRFREDGEAFTYEQVDRGHQRFRLIEVKLEDGSVRNLIDERSETFIWTSHTEGYSSPRIHWLGGDREFLYVTEKYGWRQILLIDGKSGEEVRVLTPTGIVVRSIERIDEENRTVWFSACGRDGQDPYHIHLGYASLDTGKLTWLTDGDGTHSVEFSPSGNYLIDTYSRVDLPPVSELRRTSDGEKVCDLEVADIGELKEAGWRAPEIFVAKGRDGETDIWGIICRPKDWDPNKKYPVIEDIYAGPHGSFVPKQFSPSDRYESLTKLGFIVVKIDGMGTANRSKAFHDVCWRNLKDAGFKDRILWMKSAAEQYPEMDLSRVGIYGTSAGGQNAAAAVLFHPQFYKVAVAACGCHDNRMDKASWNEQWMGLPVGEHYSASSNIDNAHRLEGKLFLIVGEVDKNVPPESTMRFADALIRANKDFDLLVIPNAGHGMGGAYGNRRMEEYFVRHLLGGEW